MSYLNWGSFLFSLLALMLTGNINTAFAYHLSDANEFRPVSPETPSFKIQAGTFSELIDHSVKPATLNTFSQRYWYDSEFASGPDAPVLYHVCGEGPCDQGYFLQDMALEWAKTLGAHVVWLEHRYYGDSQPFSDLSSAHLKYLTLDNAIEDLASFQKWISSQQGFTGSWIVVGGSYSGTLAALYRYRHPELVVGALAASAPMQGVKMQTTSQSDSITSTSISDYADSGDRQWAYEACTTVPFWIATSADANGEVLMPSSSLCQSAFGSTTPVALTNYNAANYTPFVTAGANSATNILFTNGSEDVWAQLGIQSDNSQNTGITTSLIQGAGHHFDLNYPTKSDSKAVTAARNLFIALAKQWLAK